MYGQTKINKSIEKMKAFGKEILKDPEKCKNFLIKAEIYDKDGNLTEEYKSEEK